MKLKAFALETPVSGDTQTVDVILKVRFHGAANIKGAITGTCRSCDPQHTERYLAAYEWRFNRRFDLDKNVERLARIATRTAPKSYRFFAPSRNAAETSG